MGLFDKKYCSICGDKIGLLGNRKLDDGNMCKSCAAKLSPFFSDRRHSTVEDIKKQLAYREENKKVVAQFHTTLSFGEDPKILIDEDKKQFVVTRARNLVEANPDVIDFSMITGVDANIDEDVSESYRKDKDGNSVSYNPPKYQYKYFFNVVIRVNHPYFDTIKVQLNATGVYTTDDPVPSSMKPDPMKNTEYRQFKEMLDKVTEILSGARQKLRDEAAAAAAPPTVARCPYCGANTTPDASGCCAYCGSPMNK